MALTFLCLIKVQCFQPITTSSLKLLIKTQRNSFSSKKTSKNMEMIHKLVSQNTMTAMSSTKLHRDEYENSELLYSLDDEGDGEIKPLSNELNILDQSKSNDDGRRKVSIQSNHKKALRSRPSKLLKQELMEHVSNGEPMPYSSQYHTPVR